MLDVLYSVLGEDAYLAEPVAWAATLVVQPAVLAVLLLRLLQVGASRGV